jgi:prepilin-type N-terminal cleavage/methylation domain-containing protein
MSEGRRRTNARAGYTLIEVMIAIAISSIGLSGIVFMQTATVRSNHDALETQVAITFARTWIERVKRDALLWTAPGNPPAAANRAPANNYFVAWPAPTDAPAWDVPLSLPGAFESAGANFHGVDVGARDPLLQGNPVVTNGDIYYCANTKFVTVHTSNLLPNAIRATVRVWWNRKASLNDADYTPGIQQVRGGGCQAFLPTSAQLQDAGRGRFRVVYLSTVLRWTQPT